MLLKRSVVYLVHHQQHHATSVSKHQVLDWKSVGKVMPTQRIGIYCHGAHCSYPEGFLGIKYIPHAAWTCICENLNSNSESKWSIVGMRTATLKWSFELPAGMLLLFVILWQILGAISSVSAIVAICVAFFQILSSNTWSQSFLRTCSCVWTKYYFIQYVPKYHQKLGCQANGGAHTGRAPLDPPMN